MTLLIVPNELRDELYRRIDAEITSVPDAASGREEFYRILLNHFYEHGEIPEFSLRKREIA